MPGPQACSRTQAQEQGTLSLEKTAQPGARAEPKQEGEHPQELRRAACFWVSEGIAMCPEVSEFERPTLGGLPEASRERECGCWGVEDWEQPASTSQGWRPRHGDAAG